MKFNSAILLVAGLLPIACADKYGHNYVTVRKDSDIVAKAFPDVAGAVIQSPAFLNPKDRQEGFANGTQGPNSFDDVESFLQGLAKKNKFMTYKTANFTSQEGRAFPYIHLLDQSSKGPKVRVWIQGSVHGNEPAGDQASLALLGKFAKDTAWARQILSKLELIVLPRYNPDGAFYFQRTLPTNLDPNRDHIKLAEQQTRDIKQLMDQFNPHIVADMHEYSAYSTFGNGKYKHGSDGLFAAAKNLNIHKDIRDLSEKLFANNIGKAMEAQGLRWEPYVTGSSVSGQEYVADFAEAGSDARIGRNAMGLTQAVVFLFEMRGIGLADQEFQRRTVAGLTMVNALVVTAFENATKVLNTIDDSVKNFTTVSEDIVVTDSSLVETRPWTFVEVETGKVVKAPVRFAVTTPTIANLTRSRPESYLIPSAWSRLAERLRVSGVEVETLTKSWTGQVEALTITSTKVDTGYYEGAVLVETTTKTAVRELELPPGSFRVRTNQKNAALAFVALEPENIDSYVTFNIIPVEEGDEYPIFRAIK